MIYEGLFDFDKDLNVIPQLAKSYTIENDGKVIQIELEDDVYWHDGENLLLLMLNLLSIL